MTQPVASSVLLGCESTVQLLNKVKSEFPCHSLSRWAELQSPWRIKQQCLPLNLEQDLGADIDSQPPFFLNWLKTYSCA